MKIKKYNILVSFKKESTTIPVIDVGKFKKGFVTLISQLHGDEYTSRLVSQEVIKRSSELKTGLRIIVCANRGGSKINYKFDPSTKVNLNRNFIKNNIANPKNISDMMSKAIVKLCIGSNFAIDIHDMSNSQLPICSIITLTKNKFLNTKNYSLVKRFGPDIAWLEDFSKKKVIKRYIGTINYFLNSIKIPNFTIETSSVNIISQKDISKIGEKLINIINSNARFKTVPLVERQEIYSSCYGILIPTKKSLLSKIKRGEKLGTILDDQLKETDISSPVTGILIRKSNQKFVSVNEKIFDIGKEIAWKD